MDTYNVYQLDPKYSYALKELAMTTGLSDETITRIFEEQPGVLIYQRQDTGRRLYRTFRVPGWVAIDVLDRMTTHDE